MSELPRGLRNRNPGNIRRSAVRYKGETESDDAAFKTFASTAWGYRAMFVLLHTYRVRHRIATLRGMIARWAPPSENDTGAYLRTVVRRSGVDPDAEIDTRDGPTMTRIAAAMAPPARTASTKRRRNASDGSISRPTRRPSRWRWPQATRRS